jgi:glutamate dehydrogenase (NAD(P)+)
MTVYSGPVFDMAVNQFGVIANHLSIPMDERDRILLPKRAITISCPIHRDGIGLEKVRAAKSTRGLFP